MPVAGDPNAEEEEEIINDEEKDHAQAVNYAIHFGRNTEIYTRQELLISLASLPEDDIDGKKPLNTMIVLYLDENIL